jgi:hypothetical protein
VSLRASVASCAKGKRPTGDSDQSDNGTNQTLPPHAIHLFPYAAQIACASADPLFSPVDRASSTSLFPFLLGLPRIVKIYAKVSSTDVLSRLDTHHCIQTVRKGNLRTVAAPTVTRHWFAR